MTENAGHRRPLVVGDSARGHETVCGFEHEIAYLGDRPLLLPPRFDERVTRHHLRPQERDHRVEHGEPYVLSLSAPLPREQSRGDRLRGGHSGQFVGQDRTDHARATGDAVTLDGGHTGERLNHRVVDALHRVRTRLAEATDRHVHDVGLAAANGFLADAHPVDRAGAEVLHEGVGTGAYPHQQRNAVGVLQVDHHRPFAAVGCREHGSDPGPGRSDPAHEVTGPRSLDLDDVGALISQDPRRDRTGDHGRDIDDPVAAERSGDSSAQVECSPGVPLNRQGPTPGIVVARGTRGGFRRPDPQRTGQRSRNTRHAAPRDPNDAESRLDSRRGREPRDRSAGETCSPVGDNLSRSFPVGVQRPRPRTTKAGHPCRMTRFALEGDSVLYS